MKIQISIQTQNSEVQLVHRTNDSPILATFGIEGEELTEKYRDVLFQCMDLLEDAVKEVKNG